MTYRNNTATIVHTLILLTISLGLLGTSSKTRAAESTEGIGGSLRWRNGDALDGRLVGGDARHVYWQSDIFTEPFALDMTHLQSMRFTAAAPRTATTQPLRFVTRFGDVIYGRLIRIDDQHVTIQTDEQREIVLLRTELKSFRQLVNPSAIYEGPVPLANWKTLNRGRRVSYWNTDEQGQVSTRVVGAELFRDLDLPVASEIHLTLSWRRKAGFMVAFLAPDARRLPRDLVKLETWDDDLVLQNLNDGGEFVRLMTFAPDTKSVQLRLLWNQALGELSVFTPQGELLGSMKSEGPSKGDQTAVYLKNKGPDLTFNQITVSNWNGSSSSDLPPTTSRARLRSGETLLGTLNSFDSQSSRLVFQTADGSQEHLLEEVDSIEFSGSDTIPDPTPTQAKLVFSTGSLVVGHIEKINNNILTLRPLASDQSFECDLRSTQGMTWSVRRPKENAPASEDLAGYAVLEYRNAELHGQLAPVEPDGKLGWRPVGSKNASPLLPQHPARILRSVPDDPSESQMAADDVIYLTSGEILPCKVGHIDPTHVALAAAYSDTHAIPRDQIRAIEFGTGKSSSGYGLTPENWSIDTREEKIVESQNGELSFFGPATISHPDIMRCEELTFTAAWTKSSPVVVTVSLFTERGQSGRGDYMFYFFGEQVIVQEMDGQQGIRHVSREQIARDHRAEVSISHRRGSLRMTINDRELLSQELGMRKRSGPGITMVIQPAGNVQVRGAKLPKAELLTLSNMHVSASRHSLVTMLIDPNRKNQLLTVPRSREKNPPKQMLVAENGDLLRGRLVTVDDRFIKFQSRMDEILLPRDRVDAAIWLKQVANENTTTTPPKQADNLPIEAVLMNGIEMGFTEGRMKEGVIIGQHPMLGECRLPVNDVLALRMGGFSEPGPPVTGYDTWALLPAKQPVFATADSNASGAGQFTAATALVGTKPRNFSGAMLDGNQIRLSDLKNKVIVLDFWATWCGPCVRSIPELIEAVSAYPNDVVLIGVNQQEPSDVIQEFLKVREWKLNVMLDPDGNLAQQFHVEAIPHTVVIGRDGTIKFVQVGTGGELLQRIDTIVNQAPDRS